MESIRGLRQPFHAAKDGPSPLKKNRSFVDRLLGFGSTESDDEDDDEASGESDEAADPAGSLPEVTDETLREEAQASRPAALIAHLPTLAAEKLSVAALPPYCSPEACLSLGNLLTRGSSLHPTQLPSDRDLPSLPGASGRRSSTGPPHNAHASTSTNKSSIDLHLPTISRAAASAKNQLLSLFFPPSPPIPHVESPPLVSPTRYDAASNGWIMRKEGKRVIRDVEGMGMAGGWYILGVGRVVDAELERERLMAEAHGASDFVQSEEGVYRKQGADTTDDALIMSVKGKEREKPPKLPVLGSSSAIHFPGTNSMPPSERPSTESKSSPTESSEMVKTPFETHTERGLWRARPDEGDESQRLDLLSDLLSPYLSLIRNGHIQSHDPVYLPPILPRQLPHVLRPQGDLEKGRNAWHLGGVVAEKLVKLQILQKGLKGKSSAKGGRAEVERKRIAVGVMAHYILGMTRPSTESETHFRAVVELGQCGLEPADSLVEQAAKRLDIIFRPPSRPATPTAVQTRGKEYPFPTMAVGVRSSGKGTDPSRSASSTSAHISPHKSSLLVEKRRSTTNGTSHLSARSHIRNGSDVSRISRISRGSGSIASLSSVLSTGIAPKPLTSNLSLASLDTSHDEPVHVDLTAKPTESALDTLKLVKRRDRFARDAQRDRTISQVTKSNESLWPALRGWTMKPAGGKSPASGQEDRIASLSSSPADTIRAKSRPSGRGEYDVSSSLTIRPLAASVQTMRPIASSPDIRGSSPLSVTAASCSPNTIKSFHLPGRPLHSPSPSTTSSPAAPESLEAPAGPSVPLPRPRSTLSMPDPQIAPVDPVLAAVEMASPLTKHTDCSVCGTKGVNFPECRKCGMTFCGRACRIGLNSAGDGKRHVCGVWESRKAQAQAQAPPPSAIVSATA